MGPSSLNQIKTGEYTIRANIEKVEKASPRVVEPYNLEREKEPYSIEREKELAEKILEALRPIARGYTFPELIVACYQAIFALLWEKTHKEESK